MAKKCYQIWQKVAKVAKKCYQMWQKVAKGVLSGSKRFQGLPRASKDHGLARAPTGSHGVPTGGFKGDSKGKCYRMWKKVTKGVPRDTGSSACLRCWPEGPAPAPNVDIDQNKVKCTLYIFFLLTLYDSC